MQSTSDLTVAIEHALSIDTGLGHSAATTCGCSVRGLCSQEGWSKNLNAMSGPSLKSACEPADATDRVDGVAEPERAAQVC
jgi:hypothetical protein